MAYTVWLGGTNLASGYKRVVDPDTIPDAVSKYKVDIAHELLYYMTNLICLTICMIKSHFTASPVINQVNTLTVGLLHVTLFRN